MVHIIGDYYTDVNPCGGFIVKKDLHKIDKKTGDTLYDTVGYYPNMEQAIEIGVVRRLSEDMIDGKDMELSEAVKIIKSVGDMIVKKLEEPVQTVGTMNRRIAKFHKVSEERFVNDYMDKFGLWDCPEHRELAKRIYDAIKLPKRATTGSAGYDFYSPIEFILKPGQTINIPTGIRVEMEEDWVLKCYPRSGLGFKYRLQLNNTVGIIDSDYFYSDNEGHIFAKITNDTNEGETISVEVGKGFMQGVFVPYGITTDDKAEGVRNGGFGSTDKTNNQ